MFNKKRNARGILSGKKLSKKDEYFIKVLDYERKHRANNGCNDSDEPLITPLLLEIKDTLNSVFILLFALLGAFITHLFVQ